VSLSCGSNRFHCAKTTEQIKILFGVNTLGGQKSIVLDGGPDPHSKKGGGFDEVCQIILFFCFVVR